MYATDAMTDFFTLDMYRRYLRFAISSREIVTYASIDWTKPFVLWRHDCDMSLDRAEGIAEVDAAHGVKSTFFVNLKSEYYNPLENSQRNKIRRIVELGHDIGVHLDASGLTQLDHESLGRELSRESEIISTLADQEPTAFSFHNPTARELALDDSVVLGLVNCYSKRFREEVAYCSDSNGYWRYWSIDRAITESHDRHLQVLTHPEWWHEEPLPPRARVMKAIYDHADQTMIAYDRQMRDLSRVNEGFLIGREADLELAESELLEFEYLWARGRYDLAIVDLVKALESKMGPTATPDRTAASPQGELLTAASTWLQMFRRKSDQVGLAELRSALLTLLNREEGIASP